MARPVENGVRSFEDPSGASMSVVQVALGDAHTLALTASGSVYTWGRGQFGRMGVGVFQDQLSPTPVEIVALDLEYHQNGNGGAAAHPNSFNDQTDQRSPRISQIAAGAYHSLALAANGTVWSWGFNAYGQLGRQSGASFPAPVAFPRSFSFDHDSSNKSRQDAGSGDHELVKVVSVEAGGMMSSVIDKDGGLWLWGAVPEPSAGVQITDSTDAYEKSDIFELANIDTPQRVLALRDQRVRRVACGTEHILALVDGPHGGYTECYAWGSNSYGQLGLGDFEARDMPTLITALPVPQCGAIADFACGGFHSVIVTMKSGEVGGGAGEITDYAAMARKMERTPVMMGSSSPRSRPYMAEPPRTRPRQQDHRAAYAHRTNWGRAGESDQSDAGWASTTCWAFGQNENGQLGLGTRANAHTPAVVTALPRRERIQTAACGLFHTAVVMESGDVWVWGMEGGLGQCPGIGPPGTRGGDTLAPVRVFGESSARCDPATGAKGLACGSAHTVTVATRGRDLWAWGRGKNGVLGLGHHSDSWFPSPVLWPPGAEPGAHDSDPDPTSYDAHRRSLSPTSSKSRSRGRGDEIRPYNLDDARPPRTHSHSRSEQYVREVREVEDRAPPSYNYSSSPRKGMDSSHRPSRADFAARSQSPNHSARRPDYATDRGRAQSPSPPSRQGDHFWPEAETPRRFRPGTGTEPSGTGFHYHFGGAMPSEDVAALKADMAEIRSYAESLHAAIYGGLEHFPAWIGSAYHDSRFGGARRSTSRYGSMAKRSALQEWQQHVEDASLEELAELEVFYKGMRNRLKDAMFQRTMEDWCMRAVSGTPAASNSHPEPPPVREPYSAHGTPYCDGPADLALRLSNMMSDRGELLPPAALAASLAELRMHSQRRR